jgi:hypothetical protein
VRKRYGLSTQAFGFFFRWRPQNLSPVPGSYNKTFQKKTNVIANKDKVGNHLLDAVIPDHQTNIPALVIY